MSNTYVQQPLLFAVPDSGLARCFDECELLLAFQPAVLESILRDQNKLALQKKQQRAMDVCASPMGQEVLPNLVIEQASQDASPDLEPELGAGRPRMSPRACLFFWVLSIHCGGVKSSRMKELLAESKSIVLFLSREGIKTPGLSTIAENVGAISDETRRLILDAQIAIANKDDLDDFQKIQFDSTPVDANTSWPTDSGLIWKLGERLYRRFEKLRGFGLPNLETPVLKELLEDLRKIDYQINCCSTKKPDMRRELYRRFLDDAENASHLFTTELQRLEPLANSLRLRRSKEKKLARCFDEIREDLDNLYHGITCSLERIEEGRSRPASEKVLSISDPDAALLVKGNRELRIGYRAQLARSEQGLVTAIIVPKGNVGDAVQLQELCEQSFQRTGLVPEDISADGGYASMDNRLWLLEKGVKHPSFSSSHGARITPKEDWESETFRELRRWRSAVEALMSQLKGMVGFGEAVKRGWKKVRAELTDKVIVFNFMRLSLLRP